MIKLNTYTNWEGQLLKVKGGGLSHTFVIGNIYRHSRSLNENDNEFIRDFSNAISSLTNNHRHNLILAGDFNINMLKIN